jgi:hypothetical protein
MHRHSDTIKTILPSEWTVLTDDIVLDIVDKMYDLLDVPISANEEIVAVLRGLEDLGLMLRHEDSIKSNDTWELVKVMHFNVHGDTRYVQ